MSLFKKRKTDTFNKYQDVIRERAIAIISENYPDKEAEGILERDFPDIANKRAGIDVILSFKDIYNTTLDYIFGTTDTPYFTL